MTNQLPETETVLYGTKVGAEDWQQEIITTDPNAIEGARAWALANGYDRLRTVVIDLTVPPDFAGTVNKKRVKKLVKQKNPAVLNLIEDNGN